MNCHRAKYLNDPATGHRVSIDVLIAPLVKALWEAGYETGGSCQDLGESLHNYKRKSAYWKGYALLEMPVDDALRLIDLIKYSPIFEDRMHWAHPGAWEVSLPVMAFPPFADLLAGVDPWAQIHFPNDQIDDLIKVITAG